MAITINRSNATSMVITLTEWENTTARAETDAALIGSLKTMMDLYAKRQSDAKMQAMMDQYMRLPPETQAVIDTTIATESAKGGKGGKAVATPTRIRKSTGAK